MKRVRVTEVEKIHQEIFTNSTEHKYYVLGVAQGISIVYRLIESLKGKTYTSEQWMNIINKCATQDENISDYFKRINDSKKREDLLISET
jgi:hypothetical protein